MKSRAHYFSDLFCFLLVLSVVFGAFLGSRPLMVPDEGRYSEIAREITVNKEYITPHLNEIKYLEKPPLFYWMESVPIKWFGTSEWSLRLVTALMALFGCLALYAATHKLYDRRTAILSTSILASNALYFTMGHFIILDMTLTVLLSAALLLFLLGTQETNFSQKRYYFWGMYISIGLATLTKGLIGIVLPGLIIFSWVCLLRDWRALKTYFIPSGILLFLLVVLPWHLLVQQENPDFFKFYFIDQHFLRYFTPYAHREQAFWFFPAVTLLGFFPWVCFLVPVAFSKIAQNKTKIFSKLFTMNRVTLFFTLWASAIFVFFTVSHSQLLSYALPIMPALAVLTGRYFSLAFDAQNQTDIRNGFILFALLGTVGGLGSMIVLSQLPQYNSHPFYLYLSLGLLIVGAASSFLFYQYKGLKAGFITLCITIVTFLIVGLNLAYTTFDARSVKPLAILVKPLLQPNTEVAVYHQYYQDLPLYLERRISIVEYKGELEFGTLHQDTRDWMLDETTLWKHWQNPSRMFMILRIKDYESLKNNRHKKLYPLAHTTKDILVTNGPL